MTYLLESELLQSQDTWKRSQIRLTPTLHKAVLDYTSEKELSSLNTALLALINKGLTASEKHVDRKVMFIEYNPNPPYDKESTEYKEKMRIACANFMSKFFNKNPDYKFMQFENKIIKDKKGHEILIGIRVWYSYTA